MSHVGWIDAREFARLGQVQEGRLPLAGFSRLAALLCDTGGEVAYRLQGSVDSRGNIFVGELTGRSWSRFSKDPIPKKLRVIHKLAKVAT